MKYATPGTEERIKFDMTPMIDVCFLLIIFFMLSLKLFTPEGDFNIKMPLAAPRPTDQILDTSPPIPILLRSNDQGELTKYQIGERPAKMLPRALDEQRRKALFIRDLRAQIQGVVGSAGGPGSVAASTEVEFDCDYNLHFQYVIDAITAVSGYLDDEGHIVQLIEKIKFAPPPEDKE
jgi:biopolymer transport protein ExbD